MAEAGAHLTSTSIGEQPSIFEVLAQESLLEAVRPAVQHAVKVLAESSPARFGCLWRTFDELYLLLDLLLQNHFLSRYSASFSENFYGLKRVSEGRERPVHKGLRRPAHWRSLLLLCLVPYLRAKLEARLVRQRDEEDFSIQLARSRTRRLYSAAVAAFPYISSAWRVWVFCQQLLYVFGSSRTHSPLLWLARVRLTRLTAADFRNMEASDDPAHSRVGWMMSQAARGVATSLSTFLSMGVFFLQFLEWWYSPDNQSTVRGLTSLPAPPPPLHLQQDSNSRSCPLCHKVCANATALSTSGFVFCYPCIYAHVKAHRCCPVTGFPSAPQHLIKIYAPEG
uniref:Peroxisome assembly protein 12 n=1 Tax=Oryzias sinensis TaxID=183150 RepID=A0A8C7X627_9TELE